MTDSRRFRVPAALDGRRLDHVLDELCADRTRSQLQKLVRRGRVRLDGRRVKRSNVPVRTGMEIRIGADSPPGEVPRVVVVHEDEHVLVVDKPAGVLTHRAPGREVPDVAGLLTERFGPLPTPFGEQRPGIVHRLDRETSGLLIVGRTAQAMHALQALFREQRVKKSYAALVSHVPANRPFTIEAPLEPVPGKHDRQRIARAGKGKAAVTDVELVRAFERHALLHCAPRTGRRHQIRVHLAARGFPVVRDRLYGTKRSEPLPVGLHLGRQALHARALALAHPITGEAMSFELELPEDLRTVIEGLEVGSRS